VIRVLNKIDLEAVSVPDGWVGTSAVTGEGVADLRQRILRSAGITVDADDESVVVTSERQRDELCKAARHLEAAGGAARDGLPLELIAVDVRGAAHALGQALGEEVDPEVLDAVFARFCIGK
jgi:tRNA modification GTPase